MPAAGSTVPARTLMFNYDENNSPVGFQFKSDVSNYWYFYVFAKNAQGDITSIYRRDVDANGKKYLSHIADYEYDPWGRVLSVKDSTGRDISNESNNSAAINPFRYRGYYYDTESGFYYLQSRYYDPVIKRFINADSFASTGTGFLGYNMFAYCNNNPVNYVDSTGEILMEVFAVVAYAAITLVTCLVTYVVVTSPVVQHGWEQLHREISSAFADDPDWVSDQADSIAEGVKTSYANTRREPRYNHAGEWHHIVAQGAPNADKARSVLQEVKINVDSPLNLVFLKTGLHKRLHTNKYYTWANEVVINAYRRGHTDEERKRNVIFALLRLNSLLEGMNGIVPR